jgi:hypothetical protein
VSQLLVSPGGRRSTFVIAARLAAVGVLR